MLEPRLSVPQCKLQTNSQECTMYINHNFTSTSTWDRRSQSNLVLQDLSWHANFSWTLSIWSWTFQFKFGSNLLLVLLTRRPVECGEQCFTTLTSIYIAFTIFEEGSYENDLHRFQQEKALAGASLIIVQHRFKCQNCRTLEECGEWRVARVCREVHWTAECQSLQSLAAAQQWTTSTSFMDFYCTRI